MAQNLYPNCNVTGFPIAPTPTPNPSSLGESSTSGMLLN